jgi:hypothetical protein
VLLSIMHNSDRVWQSVRLFYHPKTENSTIFWLFAELSG